MKKTVIFFLFIFLIFQTAFAAPKKNEVKPIEAKGELPEMISFQDIKKFRQLTKVEEATINNNLPLVRELLKKGEKVYPPDNKLGSPLFYAVFHDNLEMVNLLIEKGSDVNFKLQSGLTPLALAVIRNQVTLADVLIEHGANVNEEISGTKIIEYAEKFNYKYLEAFLKSKGAVSRNEQEPALKK